MKPYQDNLMPIYNKDCRSMDELPDESVQMVCTSPPYWGLRKYADLPDLIWGDNSCEHKWANQDRWLHRGTTKSLKLTDGMMTQNKTTDNTCSLCGAWKGSYGLEPTPEMYIQHTIEILREIRRVLRKDGVVFWNIGDSYWGGKGQSAYAWSTEHIDRDTIQQAYHQMGMSKGSTRPQDSKHNILKPKDLCLIPFRVAAAAQEDGWWVRSVIIWSKPNPMPESVTDRPTESHEYILMLTKSGTTQYWTHRDGGGTRERPKADYRWVNQLTNEEVAIEPADWKDKIPCSDCNGTGKETAVLWGDYEVEIGKCPECGGKGKVKLWRRINLWRGHDYYWDADAVREPYSPTERWGGDTYRGAVKQALHGEDAGLDRERSCYPDAGRNIRTVWEFPTQPYPEAHFAVFPEKLPEFCIKAATPEVGCCSKCGAPWVRVLEKEKIESNPVVLDSRKELHGPTYSRHKQSIQGGQSLVGYEGKTIGWRPTCSCNADKVPSVVLDNFCGTGTTLWVAKKLGRRAVGYELSEAYCALSLERNRQMVMELTS